MMDVSEDERLRSILDLKTVAVVGMSKDPSKYGHRVGAYLKSHGYKVIPVNPFADEIFGERSHASLLEIPEQVQKEVELIDIFRTSGDVPPIVEQAIQLKQKHGKLKAIWMQLGIINEEAAEKARAAGLEVVMNKCIMVEHIRLKGSREGSRMPST